MDRVYEASEKRIAEAQWDRLFPSVLEFNAPVHGTWNIVHTGMLIPEAHQIYVCAANCMRGVVLTAAEMNALDRFSSVILTEEDIEHGQIEDTTVEGTIDIIRRLPVRPKAVLLFTVCLHHFVGCSHKRIFERLEEAFPDIDFIRCYMDPIMKKHKTPEEKIRKSLCDSFKDCEMRKDVVSLIGSDIKIGECGDLESWLTSEGISLRQVQDCKSYSEYRAEAEACCFITVFPNGNYGASALAKRLGRDHLYLPMSFSYEEIEASTRLLADYLGIRCLDTEAERAACEEVAKSVMEEIGHTAIAIDHNVHPRPLGLARFLIEHGGNVKELFLDAINAEEEKDFYWLQEHAPEIRIYATVHPDARFRSRSRNERFLALGQKAAYFTGTDHFLNMVYGGGCYGYRGIRAFMEEMRQANREAKDAKDLVPRKGLGCVSCV